MIKALAKMQLFTKALEFASVKHQYQRRKQVGDIPYINHPIEVVNILAQAGVNDYPTLIAAVLHDTVEDTDTTPEEIEKEFGTTIKDIVMQCTDDKSLDKVTRKQLQIEHALKASSKAKLVKMGDKISNNRGLLLNAPIGWGPQRVQGYHIWSQIVCNNLKGINQILDKQVEMIWEKSGINAFSFNEKEKLLKDFYEILSAGKFT